MNALVVAGVALALWAVGGTTLSLSQLLLQSEQTFTEELDRPVSALDVDVDSGDVRVVAWDGVGVVVERRERWSLARPEASETVVDGTLRVRAGCPGALSWCDVSYVLRVPPGIGVRARSGSGDLVLRDVGEVRAETGSGDLVLSSGTGAADVRSGSGDVTVAGLDADRLLARTGSGDVTIGRSAAGTVTARTGSGDVRLRSVVPTDEVRAQTGSGDVEVLLPPGDEEYAVRVSTGSGDQDVQVPTDPRSARSIEVRTGSGDAVVRYGEAGDDR